MTCNDRMNLVSQRLSLPLFMVSRNRFREDQPRKVPIYIAKKRAFLTKHCNEENKVETKTTRHFKHLVGMYPRSAADCVNARSTNVSREVAEVKPWQLPPNLYDTTKVPFQERSGSNGAYWRKLHVEPAVAIKSKAGTPSKKLAQKGQWKFYNCGRETERMSGTCHKHKGVFLSNARARRATTRCMVSDPTIVFRDPTEPSPAHYNARLHEISYNLKEEKHRQRLNPHIFLRNSCVPAKETSIVQRHLSFQPSVGRYEVRFPKICHCPYHKEYQPGLQLLIDHEKRLKFRRQPHKKIRLRKFCAPDWEHVDGRGHRHLFHQGTKMRVKLSKDSKKSDKTLQLYPDARYIMMINQPMREFCSIRLEPYIPRPPKVRYNCLAKRHIRRQLRNNKKIVFNSGQERFPDSEWRVAQLTVTQLEQLKASLPEDRQLRDYPVMRKSMSAIKSLLYKTPDHMKPSFELALRKRLFKFLPLPGPKVLVTEADLLPPSPTGGPYKPTCFFNKKIDPANYLKSDAQTPKRLHEGTPRSSAQSSNGHPHAPISDVVVGKANSQTTVGASASVEANVQANVEATTK